MGNDGKATNRRKHGSHLAPRDELRAYADTKTLGEFDGFRFLRSALLLCFAALTLRAAFGWLSPFGRFAGARGLLCFAPKTRLISSEARIERVLRDVVTQAAKLTFVAHEVIKGVLLPKAALKAECGIDQASGEVLPGVALIDHRGLVRESGEQMDVVRHDDEVEHLIAVAIEVQKAVSDDVSDFRLAEHAGTVASIESLMPAAGVAIMVFDHQVGRKFLDPHLPTFLGGIDAVDIEPAIAIRPPTFENILRHGVRRAPGDEDHGAVLCSMRQLALGDEQLVVRIEETHAAML